MATTAFDNVDGMTQCPCCPAATPYLLVLGVPIGHSEAGFHDPRCPFFVEEKR